MPARRVTVPYGLEDLRTPGCAVRAEQRVRAAQRTRPKLLDASGVRQVRPREAAEIDGSERGDIAREVARLARTRHAAGADAPPPLVPRTERVGHVDDQRVSACVGAAGERSSDVDQAQ